MSDDAEQLAAGCIGKQRMTTAEAQRARKRPGFRGVYRCEHCRFWHPAKRARNIDNRKRQ